MATCPAVGDLSCRSAGACLHLAAVGRRPHSLPRRQRRHSWSAPDRDRKHTCCAARWARRRRRAGNVLGEHSHSRNTADSLRLTEENLRVTTRSQEETLRLAERGHRSDRYTKAIEQLGHETVDVRLGGIYALEQLSRESLDSADQAAIVEVLSAFVRVHSDPLYRANQELGALKADGYQPDFPQDVPAGTRLLVRESELRLLEHSRAVAHVNERSLPVDVQAAITVLGRLPDREGVGRGDFFGAILKEADFTRANQKGANLSADLTRAIFVAAELEGAVLRGATLKGSDFSKARLLRAPDRSRHRGRWRTQDPAPGQRRPVQRVGVLLASAPGLRIGSRCRLSTAHGAAWPATRLHRSRTSTPWSSC